MQTQMLKEFFNVWSTFRFQQVVKHLKEKYKGLYDEQNVLISATHTHSGPGGFLQYVLYIMTTQGFIKQNFEAIVTGILRVRRSEGGGKQ